MRLLIRVGKTLLRRASTKFMDKFGSKIVSGMTDTSSDAPNAFYQPKRDYNAAGTSPSEHESK